MGQPKGVSGNPNGRPVDPNIQKIRHIMRGKFLERIDTLFEELDNLKGEKYVDLSLRIAKEIMPAMAQDLSDSKTIESTSVVSIFDKLKSVHVDRKASAV